MLGGFRKTNLLNLFWRTLQLVDGLVVIGLYGVDLNRANREDKYTDGKWVHTSGSVPPELARLMSTVQVYAVVVGSLAAASAVVHGLFASVLQHKGSVIAVLFVWDWLLVILWAALSGIFGRMYLHERVEMESGIHRMKVAVGFDLAGLVLWFLTAALGTWLFLSERRGSVGRSDRGKA